VQKKSYGGTSPLFSPPASLPLPPPFSSCILPTFPSSPFPALPSLAPLIAARGLGERFSSHSESGRRPVAKQYLVNLRLKISPLVASIFRSFSGNDTSNWGSWLPSVNILDYHPGLSEVRVRNFAFRWGKDRRVAQRRSTIDR